MNRYKYLFKNIGLLTLSGFSTKLLSFFLVPLYTNILSTTEYGFYDLINITIGILIPLLTSNIQESVIRFTLDKNYKREAVITIATKYLITSSAIIFVIIFINYFCEFSVLLNRYCIFFFLMFFVKALSGIVLAYIRGVEKITDFSISSIIASIVTIVSNIIFLVIFKWGLEGYFIANIIGPLIQCVYLIIKGRIFQSIDIKKNYYNENKEMLKYSKPMIANSIAWWINSASDRYIIIFFCGMAENGVYSVASKIPSILNIFQTIFAQAWTLSVVKDFDPEDSNQFFENTYKSYNCMLTIVCSTIIILNQFLAKFLYAKEFYIAWKYVPWLTIAILFGALSGYLGGFFSAVKNSGIFAQSTMVGAFINVILNSIFVPQIGAFGAAISTALSYFTVWVVRYWHSKKYIKLKIDICRDVISYLILIAQSLVSIKMSNIVAMYLIESVLFCIVVSLYSKDILMILKKIVLRKM